MILLRLLYCTIRLQWIRIRLWWLRSGVREHLVKIQAFLSACWYTFKKMLSLLRSVFSRLRQGYSFNSAVICAIEEEERKHQETMRKKMACLHEIRDQLESTFKDS